MPQARLLKSLVFLFLASAGFAAAQITIGTVVNAGSRIQSASQFYGIAQGSLFAITGKGLGPDDLQASFPLPTTDGLGGVTVQASVGGATVDCIMVYVRATEVGAILPSMTPIGTGTVTVNNNGLTASKPITVVAAAFGIFPHRTAALAGQALAFSVAADGSTTPIGNAQSAQPGQDVLINGTGLGAISSDETQSGVSDVPAATIQVYVGVKPAVVISAGRGLCCDGVEPDYPVPQGIAAWDVIRFTIPDGVAGCFIPVAVQIGNIVSNLATISIDSSGAACTPTGNTLPPALVQQLAGKTGVSLGSVSLGRGTGIALRANGTINTTKGDTGSATFIRYDNVPASMFTTEYKYSENVCQINGYPGPNGGAVVNGTEAPIVPLKATALDAGPSITIKGPSGTRTITKRTAGMLFDYPGTTFGDTTPGNYFDPGHYTVTGLGGKDVGAFTASTDVPAAQFVWTNIPSLTTPIDRSKDLTITWTGGTPDTQVTVVGGSLQNGVSAAFLCAAPVSAGHMTIPAYVLLNLSPSGPPLNFGQLTVGNRSVSTVTIPGLDLASIAYGVGFTMYPKFE